MKKNNSKSWLILGGVFLVILFVFAFLVESNILYVSYGAEALASAIFGLGGVIFLIVGIIKFIVGKIKK